MITRVPGVIEADIDGERVLLAPSSLTYFGLNGVGTRVWDHIGESGIDEHALITSLLEEFDVDEGTCRTDVHEFLLAAESAEVIVL